MRKHLLFSLMLFLVASLALSQQSVDEKRLAKAQEKGNVLFESVLKDANMVLAVKKSLDTELEMKYWTLKFENGAVLSIWEGPNANEVMGHLWWIGKRYVVYCKKTLGAVTSVYVELLKDQKKVA